MTRDQAFDGMGEHCVTSALGSVGEVEKINLLEHRIDWAREGFEGYVTNVTLRSGLELVVSAARAATFTRLVMDGGPTDLIFVLSRGTGITVSINGDKPYLSGAGTLEVSQVKNSVKMVSELAPAAQNEFVVLKLSHELMTQLLGVVQLPALVERVARSEESFSRSVVPMTVGLFRLLDELLYCADEGATRQLFLEGKALEVLARIFEAFEKGTCKKRAVLTAEDVSRLQTVRKILLSNISAPPSLVQLACDAGINQTKLKQDFRTLFGLPIYSYLRDRRLAEAHKLLETGELNVTNVASRVGYANASKFASAFKKRFGVAPSAVRPGP